MMRLMKQWLNQSQATKKEYTFMGIVSHETGDDEISKFRQRQTNKQTRSGIRYYGYYQEIVRTTTLLNDQTEQNHYNNVYSFQIFQVIPELYIQYQLVTLFLYFKDLKAQNMFIKLQDWTYFHTFIFVSVLATISFKLTRTLYDDIILPIFIEKGEFDTIIERKLSVARKIQIIICDLTDMMTGTALLYVCYNNTKFSLKKKQRKHQRFMRYYKKMQNNKMGNNLTTFSNQDSTTNDINTDNRPKKKDHQMHLSFQFENGFGYQNKNWQLKTLQTNRIENSLVIHEQ
eukprot:403367131